MQHTPTTPPLRAIIELDLDYFYAQAEEVLNPSLRGKPVAIQQKHIVVTCNYPARERGVGKLVLLSDALKKCPDLTVILGEDISIYRRFSRHISNIVRLLMNGSLGKEDPNHLKKLIEAALSTRMTNSTDPPPKQWIVQVERLGMDELFLDVTQLIQKHLETRDNHSWPDGEIVFRLPSSYEDNQELKEELGCWAAGFSYRPGTFHPETHLVGSDMVDQMPRDQLEYLQLASHIAAHIRQTIKGLAGFTTSAGISHNKLFSKIAASVKKPNAMTVILPGEDGNRLFDKMDVRAVPGIGYSTMKALFARLERDKGSGFWTDDAPNTNGNAYNSSEIMMGDDDEDGEAYASQKDDSETGNLSTEPRGGPKRTVKAFREQTSLQLLQETLGDTLGLKIYDLLRGRDSSPVLSTGWSLQISVEDSFQSCKTLDDARAHLLDCCESLISRFDEEELIASTNTDQKTYRRKAKSIRLTIRRRIPGRRAMMADRESKSGPMPVEFYDYSLSAKQRAEIIVDHALIPLLKRLLSPLSTTTSGGPVKSAANDEWDLTLINVAAVDLKRGEPAYRSIASYFSNAPSKETIETKKTHEPPPTFIDESFLHRLDIDPLVWVELPPNIQAEIVRANQSAKVQEAQEYNTPPDKRKSKVPSAEDLKSKRRKSSKSSSFGSGGPLDKYFSSSRSS
ncbi:hypothetical protein HDV05_006435 [Chytridiales sp. JEL 0842]|nr:hypothetical protein HDV05_006435 [Chytridiales sp. JEL 0842]